MSKLAGVYTPIFKKALDHDHKTPGFLVQFEKVLEALVPSGPSDLPLIPGKVADLVRNLPPQYSKTEFTAVIEDFVAATQKLIDDGTVTLCDDAKSSPATYRTKDMRAI